MPTETITPRTVLDEMTKEYRKESTQYSKMQRALVGSPFDHVFQLKWKVTAIRGFFNQVEPESVRRKALQNFNWIHDVSNTFTHLGQVRSQHPAVAKDSFGQRYASRQEHARPNHAMEPHDVFANDVDIAWPRHNTTVRSSISIRTCRNRDQNLSMKKLSINVPKLVSKRILFVAVVNARDVIR